MILNDKFSILQTQLLSTMYIKLHVHNILQYFHITLQFKNVAIASHYIQYTREDSEGRTTFFRLFVCSPVDIKC